MKLQGVLQEKQTLAGMLLCATKLGLEAVLEEKHFDTAVVFGQSRVVHGDLKKKNVLDHVNVYKMLLDFKKGSCTITKGNKSIPVGHIIYKIKEFLENPAV